MTLELLTNLKFVHRTNIARYKKILATYLTDGERHFVERRLAEEQASLEQPELRPRVARSAFLSTRRRNADSSYAVIYLPVCSMQRTYMGRT